MQVVYWCTNPIKAVTVVQAICYKRIIIIIIIIMNNILTRYNFTYTNINYVHNIKRKKAIFQPAVLTQAEIRNILFTRRLF
jgi:N-acyl-L-homoserine lactone synthetase